MVSRKNSGWDAKPRTMLRHIKPGDLFAFSLGDGKYGFGRIISAVSLGHVAEFFDRIADAPNFDVRDMINSKRLKQPVVLDSYSLFDRKMEGDWRIVAHQEDFNPTGVGEIFFTYGDGAGRRKVDVFGSESHVSEKEAKDLPFYSPFGDEDVKREVYGLEI
ncbi:immunity 26/phosphotriesterase HocA family protein [Burkholderia pseudomultivorans]|uniref:immunity 26/phosphotriesterase HocA family protein n=1 Tax=Burkholderia pseudomultivorans TaxID=1207504 RepID=UPI0009BD1F94|nr:immunity 26/phosphotriesterase HocA family protein [Burkholderia pseudomultivorans]